jgi:diguanylate cyclase (GGDEF)-like protein
MTLMGKLIIDIYSMVILVVLFILVRKQIDQDQKENKLFFLLLFVTIGLLVFDMLGSLDGFSSPWYPILNKVGNTGLFMLAQVAACLWIYYVYYTLVSTEKNTFLVVLLFVLAIANAVLTIGSLIPGTDLYFTIDSENVYHRASLYPFSVFLILACILASVILVLANYKNIDHDRFFTALGFNIFPLIGLIIQYFAPGVTYSILGMVFGFIIGAMNIQYSNATTDFLTGVYNRRSLDTYLARKIKNMKKNEKFAAFMLDLNNFKIINDKYGHNAGDTALEEAANILKRVVSPHDYLARFGGDEFFIISNIDSERDIRSLVWQIQRQTIRYNQASSRPYKIEFSIGYSVYRKNSGMTAKQFKNVVDKLMYEDKYLHSMSPSFYEGGNNSSDSDFIDSEDTTKI